MKNMAPSRDASIHEFRHFPADRLLQQTDRFAIVLAGAQRPMNLEVISDG